MLTSTTITVSNSMANTLTAQARARALSARFKKSKRVSKPGLKPEVADKIFSSAIAALPKGSAARVAIESDRETLGVNAQTTDIFDLIKKVNLVADPLFLPTLKELDGKIGAAVVKSKELWYGDNYTARFLTPREGKGCGYLVHVRRQVTAAIAALEGRKVGEPVPNEVRKQAQMALKNAKSLLWALTHPSESERQKFTGRRDEGHRRGRNLKRGVRREDVNTAESLSPVMDLDTVGGDFMQDGKQVMSRRQTRRFTA